MSKYFKATITRNDADATLLKLESTIKSEKLLDEAVVIQLARIRKRFLREEGPNGEKWPRSFAAIKREKVGRGGGTLFDTGRLFHSIQSRTKGKGLRSIYTDVPYAAKHQFGLDGMPKREFLSASDDDVNLIAQFIKSKLDEVA